MKINHLRQILWSRLGERGVHPKGYGCGCRLGAGGGREAEGRVGRPRVRTPCLHSSKHPIRSQSGGNNGQTPGEIGFRAPLFWVQVLVRPLLASECPARANAELADNFRSFCRRQKMAARRWTPGADSGRAEASPAKIPRDTQGFGMKPRRVVSRYGDK